MPQKKIKLTASFQIAECRRAAGSIAIKDIWKQYYTEKLWWPEPNSPCTTHMKLF